MNFDELDKQYSYYNNNDYKKYIADDVLMYEIIQYLTKNRYCIKDIITWFQLKSRKKCKFLKCFCKQDKLKIHIPKIKY